MKRLLPVMLFLCSLLNKSSIAQNLSDFKKVEGLNSNVVYCVMQDSKGYIWVGTEAGAARYDGYKFTHYTTDDGLTDNDVFKIQEDAKGRLWFLTNSGKPCLYDNGKILNATNTAWLAHIQPKKLAIHFLIANNKSIWYTTLDTIYHISEDKVVDKITRQTNKVEAQSLLAIHNYKDSVYAMYNCGVYNITSKKNYSVDSSNCIPAIHTRLYFRNSDVFYFSYNILNVYSLVSHTTTRFSGLPKNESFLVFIPTSHPDTVLVTTNNFNYKLSLKSKQLIKQKLSQISFITDWFEDIEGNAWISSLRDGLFFKSKTTESSIIKMGDLLSNKKLKSTVVSKIDNHIYFGFEDGNYLIRKGIKTIYQQLNQSTFKYKVLQFYKDSAALWIVTANDVLRIKNNAQSQAYFTVKQIAVNNNAMYLASSQGLIKIYKYSYDKLRLVKPNHNIKFITTTRCSKLLNLSDDTLLVGGIMGLQLIVNDKPAPALQWGSILGAAYTSKLILTHSNHIAIATYNKGIGIFNKDTCYNINTSNGLLSNMCNSITSVNDKTLWIATSKGINKLTYTIDNNKKISYQIEDYSYLFNNTSQNINDLLQSNDTLYIAADKGAYYHVLSKKLPEQFAPKLIIESLVINDSLHYPQTRFQLSAHQNKIRINFIGLAFQAEGKLRYRYKLMPTDTTWQETTNSFVEYPYLAYGKYEFIVTASIPGGKWSKHYATVSININKPFWLQWWFLLLMISIVLLFIRYILGNAKKTLLLEKQSIQMKLDKVTFDRQLTELQQKALTLQMNPHFIFNAINAIKGFYAAGNTEKAKDFINAFSTLMRSMLDSANNSLHSLKDELVFIQKYLDFCLMRYDNCFTYQITIDTLINTASISIPVMLLQPIVENAVLHGLTPLTTRGLLQISIQVEFDKLTIQIQDNGIGRKAAQRLNSFANHKGLGIELVKQRIHLLGKGNKSFGCIIEDKADEKNIALGTMVTLVIPLTKYDS